MESIGAYEEVVLRALEADGPAPWGMDDLRRAESRVMDALCAAVAEPPCDAAAIRDWLMALSDEQKRDVLDHLNRYSEAVVGA